jgi:hypothetical protein
MISAANPMIAPKVLKAIPDPLQNHYLTRPNRN